MMFVLLSVLFGANVGCIVIDAQYHPLMIIANATAAVVCLAGAIRALD